MKQGMKMKLARSIATAVLAGTALTAPATAAVYSFVLSGTDSATFQLPARPTPDSFFDPISFTILGVSGTFNGAPLTFDLGFVTTQFAGGFSLSVGDDVLVNTIGEQLFTGSAEAPTFKLGTFAMTDANSLPGNWSLTISDQPLPGGDPVPEPESWLMLLSGFFAIGATLRAGRVSVEYRLA